MIVNIKLSTGKEIELTLDEMNELSNFFKEQNKLNIPPYIPENPYPKVWYTTSTPNIPMFPVVICKVGS
ncbi:MAG: hypothetical protein PHF86_14870 [Candidatus Nanoarchaeia archaeon]|nr:hypothetical protein [Candidatus Nanoarchaeia archaeon]